MYGPDEVITRRSLTIQGIILISSIVFAFLIMFTADGFIPLDYINFFIHEAGHMLFMYATQFFYVLGGSLVQILVPLFFSLYFFLRKKHFTTGFMIFWLGNNVCSVGKYMADAQTMKIELIHHKHDWNWLFGSMRLLPYDQVIGGLFWGLGLFTLFIGLVIMYYFTLIYIKKYYILTHPKKD